MDYKPTGPADRVSRLKCGDWVRVHEIPGIMADEDAAAAVSFFARWKRMGFPYGPWGENPNPLVEVVDLLEPLDRFYTPPIHL